MEKLYNLYNYVKLALVTELLLIGSMDLEDFHFGTAIVLGISFALTCGFLLFLRKAIRVYKEKLRKATKAVRSYNSKQRAA